MVVAPLHQRLFPSTSILCFLPVRGSSPHISLDHMNALALQHFVGLFALCATQRNPLLLGRVVFVKAGFWLKHMSSGNGL
ncbi:hypothetical protein F5Y06DRAFT_272901 [Hypoxylon sp. FL0890]|nr:hypothetical protein F5Y06DRAFT_272901 [Hypoxylon sp. FL0890]